MRSRYVSGGLVVGAGVELERVALHFDLFSPPL